MSRRANKTTQRQVAFSWSHKFDGRFTLAYDHAANADAGEVITNLFSAPGRCVIESMRYVNPTGLAEHAANFATISLKQGAVVVGSWSTETTVGDGSLVADTYVDLTPGAAATQIIEADEELTLSVNEAGTTTVPAGRIEVVLKVIGDDVAFKVLRALKSMRVDRVDLKLLSGLAASDTDYYVFQLKNGATVVASYSTKTTGGDGALTANTFAAMTLSATDANLVLAAGATLDLDCAETGDAVLSDMELVIHGRYL